MISSVMRSLIQKSTQNTTSERRGLSSLLRNTALQTMHQKPQTPCFYPQDISLPGFNVTHKGEALEVEWTKGVRSEFHSVWLRYNDPANRDPDSGDRAHMASMDVDVDIRIRHVVFDWDNSVFRVFFENADVSDFDAKYLWENSHEKWLQTRANQLSHQAEWKAEPEKSEEMPTVKGNFDAFMTSESEEALWEAMSKINKYGFCVVKTGNKKRDTIEKMCNRLGGLQETYFGKVFDVISKYQYPMNAAYSNVKLEAHMDLNVFEAPPGLQLLHCLANQTENIVGGESTLVDAFAVANHLRAVDPQAFETLCTVSVTHRRVNGTTDYSYSKPHIALSKADGASVTSVRWYPFSEAPLTSLGSAAEMKEYFRAYKVMSDLMNGSEHTVEFRLEEGDVVVFNNRRMGHGRSAFQQLGDSSRHLRGGYVRLDDFQSLYRTMRTHKLNNGESQVPPLTLCGDSSD